LRGRAEMASAVAAPVAKRVAARLAGQGRWRLGEFAFWALAFGALALVPSRHLILNEIAILALFAVSLDLILGYAGIVSLGHAAFFGFGAYAAGLLAKHVIGDPLIGLLAAGGASAVLGFLTSFLVLRGSDLTRLMVTLGVALVLGEIANQAAWLTGGADGLQGITLSPIFGLFAFDLFGTTAYAYSLTVLFLLFLLARRLVNSPFGLSLRSIRDNPLRAAAIGVPVNARLVAIYTVSAAYAGIAGALLAQTTQFVSLDVLEFHRSADVLLVLVIGGTGYLYGGIIGAVLFKIAQDVLAGLTPQYWHFWIGLLLVVLVLVGRERMSKGIGALVQSVVSRIRPRPPVAAETSVREV
jgi:branched-chain amino acid transport system permease protein